MCIRDRDEPLRAVSAAQGRLGLRRSSRRISRQRTGAGHDELVPGVPGISTNIEAISIVDRYLEHARVFIFHNRGEEQIYLSSADWMERNLSYRVETAFPIFDQDIKHEIHRLMLIQWGDNMKARKLQHKHVNEYVRNDGDFPNRSQEESYYFIKRKEELFTSQED